MATRERNFSYFLNPFRITLINVIIVTLIILCSFYRRRVINAANGSLTGGKIILDTFQISTLISRFIF